MTYIARRIQIQLDLIKHRFLVNDVTSIQELLSLAQELQFNYFTHYASKPATKQREFRAAVEHLGLNLAGKTVFDIGPGTADSLDVARAMGARSTLFIDSEPFFHKYATLKGHSGKLADYTIYPYFPRRLYGSIDFVWSKGSINCEAVNVRSLKNVLKGFSFPRWIRAIKRLLTPGGYVLLMPAMSRQPTQIRDETYDISTYHWCPDVDIFRRSYFCEVLRQEGFATVENVAGYNHPISFPLAFVYHDPIPSTP